MEDQKINALVNIGQSKVVEKTYDDLLSTPNKKIGLALGTIVDLGNTVLWPVRWVNERTRIFFENNLKKYQQRLESVSEEKIVTVPTEISIPILERFTYVSNEHLSDAFVNLLSSASSSDTISLAHPGFISVIDRLSPDEAKIIKFLGEKHHIPKLDIKRRAEGTEYTLLVQNETGIRNEVELTFPENVDLYFDNLISVGITQATQYYYVNLEEKFSELEKSFQDLYNQSKLDGDTDEKHQQRKIVEKGMYVLTSYGSLFVKACISS